MKYKVVKGCQWRDFSVYGQEGKEIGESELKADGKPLPPEVLAHFVASGCLAPVGE